MKIHPFEERIVIEVQETGEKKVGGLIIPDTAKEKPQAGVVVSVGTGEEIQKMVKEGDLVIFNKYSGNEFHIEGKDYIILAKDDVLAKLS
ncbi:co-chaperone GroES [Myxococcota bacterium]|nr:co-chaperone GroES [Myxococcota bacterium]